MKNKYRFILTLLFILILITSFSFAFHFQNGRQRSETVNSTKTDTMYSKPHDVYPDELINQIPHSDYPPGVTFGSTETPIVYNNVNISQNFAPQNEPSVKFSKTVTGRVVAAWRDFRISANPAIRRVGFSFSTDAGVTWSVSQLLPLPDPAHPRTSDPAVGVDLNGNFYIATISINNSDADGVVLVYKSTNGGVSFDNGYIAAQSTGQGGFGEDKEYITADLDPASPFANTLYISWTRFVSGQRILLTKSTNGGVNWSNPPTPVSDVTSGVQGSDPAVGNHGEIYVVWDGPGGITFDKSTNGGNSFGTDIVISSESFTNGFPSIAVPPVGPSRVAPLFVVWSDARNGDYDVFCSASFNKGQTWTAPVRVNDDPISNGKIQYWPWVSVNEQGKIAIVYYDTRNTPNNTIIEAYVATSTDQGATFSNALLSTQQSPTNQPNGDVRFGDYIGIDFQGNKIVPVWTDERAGGFDMEIYTAVVDITVGIQPAAENIPSEFELKQNYPNPFNPATIINFSLPKTTDIKLMVLDVTGRVISILADGRKNAGTYSVKWDASSFSSGVYFCKLTAGDYSETKKMILLK